MKKYLSFIFLILAFFSADVMAIKRLPPGAEGATTGKANLLIMVPAAGKDTSCLWAVHETSHGNTQSSSRLAFMVLKLCCTSWSRFG